MPDNGIHTIPVPRGWSAEQSWEAIARGELLTDPEPNWANVEVQDGRYVRLHSPITSPCNNTGDCACGNDPAMWCKPEPEEDP